MADDKFVTHSHCFAVVPGIGYAVAALNLEQKPARQPQRDEQVPDSLRNSLLRDQLMNRIEVSCLGCGVENVDTIRPQRFGVGSVWREQAECDCTCPAGERGHGISLYRWFRTDGCRSNYYRQSRSN